MKGHEDGGLRLECTSMGWYPEPLAVWRDPYGEIVPALEEAYTEDTDGLFMVTLAVIVRDCSVRNMTCSVNNTLLSQEKDSVIFIPGQSPALWGPAGMQGPQWTDCNWSRHGGQGGRVLGPEEPQAAAELRPLPLSQRTI